MSSVVTAKQIQIKGLKAVDEQLAMLGRADGTRILRRSMLKAGQPILNRARATVSAFSRGSGALHKSLGMRFLYGRQKRQTAFVPPMGGNFRVQVMAFAKDRVALALYSLYYQLKKPAKRMSYAHLVEFGFRRGKTMVRGRSFLGSALRMTTHNVVTIFSREMADGIAKQLRRNARKARAKG